MAPVEAVAGGRRWRIAWESSPGQYEVQVWRWKTWESVAEAHSLPLLLMAIREAGFRAVYGDAVEALGKVLEESLIGEPDASRSPRGRRRSSSVSWWRLQGALHERLNVIHHAIPEFVGEARPLLQASPVPGGVVHPGAGRRQHHGVS